MNKMEKKKISGSRRAERWVCGDLLKLNNKGGRYISAFRNLDDKSPYGGSVIGSIKPGLLMIYLDEVAIKAEGYAMNTVYVKVLTGEQIIWVPAERCNLVPRGVAKMQLSEDALKGGGTEYKFLSGTTPIREAQTAIISDDSEL